MFQHKRSNNNNNNKSTIKDKTAVATAIAIDKTERTTAQLITTLHVATKEI
jgi:hypothetical protein